MVKNPIKVFGRIKPVLIKNQAEVRSEALSMPVLIFKQPVPDKSVRKQPFQHSLWIDAKRAGRLCSDYRITKSTRRLTTMRRSPLIYGHILSQRQNQKLSPLGQSPRSRGALR